MTGMGRPRQKNKDLPPGLYCYKGRSCYIKMHEEMEAVTLGTSDRAQALAIYWEFRPLYDAEQQNAAAAALVDRLQTAAKGNDRLTVAAYARAWREQHLPTLLKRDGRPLADKTREDYARMIKHQIEEHEPFQTLAMTALRTRDTRQFLSRWIGNPSYYNYVKAVLSRMCQQAVDEGLLDANPVADVNRRAVRRREVVCPMPDYLAITAQLQEWEARACDLIYLISHRPADVLRLQDRAPWITYGRRKDPATGQEFDAVIVSFTPTKNDQAMEVFDHVAKPGGIEETLQWFRQWKASQEFVTPHLVVFPRTARRRDIGRPISRDYLARRFAEALAAAGFPKGAYTPRDLRKTGLDDEAQLAGEATKKGGHKTEQMRRYYVVSGLPQRVQNNLVVMRTAK